MFKPVIYNTNPVKLCIVNLHLLGTKSLKSICYKENTVMHFQVTKYHLQRSCYSKQENGEKKKDAKPKIFKINKGLLPGFLVGI